MSKKHWRITLWRWHRRLGLALFVMVIWVSITGILLNHTDAFDLADQPVHQSWLLKLYGIERPAVTSYEVDHHWISHSGDHLYLDNQSITHCLGKFSGLGVASATEASPLIMAAACGEDIVLLTSQGDILERLSNSLQLPSPISQLGQCDADKAKQICFSDSKNNYLLDTNASQWQITNHKIIALPTTEMPKNLQQELNKTLVSLNWERVILDIHSGQILGWGPWLMDAVAILLIILGLSGIGIWVISKRR